MKTLEITTDKRGVAYVALDRPDKRNALNSEMIDDLAEMAATIGASPDTRAIVLSGNGKTFCAGGDLNWMKQQIEADRSTRMAEARKLAQMLKALNEMPTPLIGKIHGAAMGGGIGMACVCDVALASSDTKFGLTETRLGLIPATISPYVLARIGEGMARRVFMSSRVFGAAEAQALGVIAKAVSAADLDAAIDNEVTPYLSVAPGAVGRAKALARKLGDPIDESTIEMTVQVLADQWQSDEASQGIEAFLTKSTAPWNAG